MRRLARCAELRMFSAVFLFSPAPSLEKRCSDLRDRGIGGKFLAIFSAANNRRSALSHLVRCHFTDGELLEALAMDGPMPLGEEDVEPGPDCLRCRVAEDLLGALVKQDDSLIFIE